VLSVDKASSLLEAEETGDEPANNPNASFIRAPLRPLESGVFPGARTKVSDDNLVGSLQGALTAASRGEAGLASLHRSLRDASRALTASRHAHQALTEELREMYRTLTEMSAEKAAVERYAALLTQERDAALDAAEEARRESKRERDFLVREQDRFIQLIVEEHEAEVEKLKEELARGRVDVSAASPETERSGYPGASYPVASYPASTRASAARLARVELARTERLANEAVEPEGPEPGAELDLEVRRSSYPPGNILDLDSGAYEVDGNSERPPPIRRLEISESHVELKPARVPQIIDTGASDSEEPGPPRDD
jgi:hypothetical protein